MFRLILIHLFLIFAFLVFSSKTYGQNHDLAIYTGYNFSKPYLTERQYTPHYWFQYLYGNENIQGGLVYMGNTDRIERKWPNQGTYYQTKKQIGWGLVGSFKYNIAEKIDFTTSFSFGINKQNWALETDNDFIKKAVEVRDEKQENFVLFKLGLSYKIAPKLSLSAEAAFGENNVLIGLSKRL